MTSQIIAFEGVVIDDWIDYNGHMNDACYVVVFSKAIDNFMLSIGLDETFRTEKQVSIYTIQSMVHYLQEVSGGEPIRVEAQLLESDSKKLRVYFTMLHGSEGHELATMETLLLHIDMSTHRAASFQPETQALVDKIQQAHCEIPMPELAGSSIALRRK